MRPAFPSLGLLWNPFGAVPDDEADPLLVPAFPIEETAAWIRRPRRALVLRGDAGRGKSTHLRALHRCCPAAPFTYLPPEARASTRVACGSITFVDEVQRLSRRARRRVWRRSSSVALASHEGLDAELRAAGFEVDERVIGTPGLDDLRRIVARRASWAQLREGIRAPLWADADLSRLHAMHGDDLRSILRELYEQVETARRERGAA